MGKGRRGERELSTGGGRRRRTKVVVWEEKLGKGSPILLLFLFSFSMLAHRMLGLPSSSPAPSLSPHRYYILAPPPPPPPSLPPPLPPSLS